MPRLDDVAVDAGRSSGLPPRFSLVKLAILLLLAASGFGLWWRLGNRRQNIDDLTGPALLHPERRDDGESDRGHGDSSEAPSPVPPAQGEQGNFERIVITNAAVEAAVEKTNAFWKSPEKYGPEDAKDLVKAFDILIAHPKHSTKCHLEYAHIAYYGDKSSLPYLAEALRLNVREVEKRQGVVSCNAWHIQDALRKLTSVELPKAGYDDWMNYLKKHGLYKEIVFEE